jgi:hypothetical protein
LGDGNTNGGGIVNDVREPDALPKLLAGAEPNGLLFALLAMADANGFDFAYDENPPGYQMAMVNLVRKGSTAMV